MVIWSFCRVGRLVNSSLGRLVRKPLKKRQVQKLPNDRYDVPDKTAHIRDLPPRSTTDKTCFFALGLPILRRFLTNRTKRRTRPTDHEPGAHIDIIWDIS